MECKHKSTDRTGLYIMVFIAMCAACDAKSNSVQLLERLNKIEQSLKDCK